MSNSHSRPEAQLRRIAVAVAVAAVGAGLVTAAALIRRQHAAKSQVLTVQPAAPTAVRIPVTTVPSEPVRIPVKVKGSTATTAPDRSVPKERWVPQLG